MGKVKKGKKYGRLTVMDDKTTLVCKRYKWRCQCSCGEIRFVASCDLISLRQKSCGCWKKEKDGASKRYSELYPKEYRTWHSIKIRCYNKNYPDYKHYGGRGIRVCLRWKNSFINFLTDIGIAPSNKHSLDRFPNVNGHYEPENVRWATSHEQARNRTSNINLEHGGLVLCSLDWANKLKVKRTTLDYHVRKKRTIAEILKIKGLVMMSDGTILDENIVN